MAIARRGGAVLASNSIGSGVTNTAAPTGQVSKMMMRSAMMICSHEEESDSLFRRQG